MFKDMTDNDFEVLLVQDCVSVSEAVKRIDEGGRKIIFCVNDGRLTGSFTDGDMRRFILRDGDMQSPVYNAMNRNPYTLNVLQTDQAETIFREKGFAAIPVINERKEVVNIIFSGDPDSFVLRRKIPDDVPLVVMAGGKGTRLYPYTRVLPKPLIPIGDMPILDHIITRFGKYGIKDMYLILNYKKNMIKAYYNEADLPYNINYVDEEQFLGTGGGLSLLKGKIHNTFFLSNCDCLLDSDYMCMYDYHKDNRNAITMILATRRVPIPYGVVSLNNNGSIKDMTEKPEYDFLVNTGIYIVEPFVIDFIKDGEAIGMPDIAKRLMDAGYNVGGYPITEKSWLDMGQINEMQNMIKELGL